MGEKLEELTSLVQHERQALTELTTIAHHYRSNEVSKVTSSVQPNSIDAIIRDRSDKIE